MQKINNLIKQKSTANLTQYDFVKEWNSRQGNLKHGFNCDLCKNRGHTYKYYKDTKKEYMQECICMQRRKTIDTLKQKGLSNLLTYKVADFKSDYDWQKKMKQTAIDYVKNDSREWICFIGQSGVGKTHLASAVAVTLIEKNVQFEHMMWSSFVKDYTADTLNKNDGEEDLLKKYKTAEVLFIDDLFKSKNSDFVVMTAFDLINYRDVNNLTTIITSELSLKEMRDLDGATAGRIGKKSSKYYVFIEKDADKDYRLK
jgi:DNA replication protein DnaC